MSTFFPNNVRIYRDTAVSGVLVLSDNSREYFFNPKDYADGWKITYFDMSTDIQIQWDDLTETEQGYVYEYFLSK